MSGAQNAMSIRKGIRTLLIRLYESAAASVGGVEVLGLSLAGDMAPAPVQTHISVVWPYALACQPAQVHKSGTCRGVSCRRTLHTCNWTAAICLSCIRVMHWGAEAQALDAMQSCKRTIPGHADINHFS